MPRQLTPASRISNLRKEAKQWLAALRARDPDARSRFERALPSFDGDPGLRDVQHALAREFGLSGWTALRDAVAAIAAGAANDREDAIIALLHASGRGDVRTVRALLDTWPDILNARAFLPGNDGRRSALHYAVAHRDVVRLLLERGADPNLRDDGDNALPIHFAAEREDLDVIRLLVEHGSDVVGDGDTHGLGVIGWATCFGSGRAEVVEYLLAHGARHNLFSAVATGAVDDVRSIASAGADLDAPMDRANRRRPALHLAVVRRQTRVLELLIELGADVEAVDGGGLTALDQAALDGEAVMVKALIDGGAHIGMPAAIALDMTDDIARALQSEPDALKPGGRWGTLIIRASEHASGDTIRALLRAGSSASVADETTTSVDGTPRYTPLHAAAFHGNEDAAAVLLEHGADPNARDGRYCSPPAGWAQYAGHFGVRDLILESLIDPFQAIDFDRVERISEIVQRGPSMVERRFADYGSCERTADYHPEPWHTPLAWAVVRGRADAVRALLGQGAIPIVAPDGRSLVQIAVEKGNDEIVRLLREPFDATPEARLAWFVRNACPDHGVRGRPAHEVAHHTAERLLQRYPEIATSSLAGAAICGRIDRVRRILDERPGAARERTGPKSWQPLLYLCFTRLPSVRAASDNAVSIAELLIDHGADANDFFMAGDSRYTPMTGVAGEGEEDRPPHPQRDALATLLLQRGANPYDTQVLYDVSFHGEPMWFLERIYEHSARAGRLADWRDGDWTMLDMGGYGNGARYLLEIALQKNDVALALWLLEHGANPNAAPAGDPRLPRESLHTLAVRRGRTAIAQLLLRHGAIPDGTEPTDDERFASACAFEPLETVRGLALSRPANLVSHHALAEAVRRDRVDVVGMLLDLGMPVELENERRQRPLHIAAMSGACDVARLLIERGAAIDPVEESWGNTPLDFAVYHQHGRMIDVLSEHSRDVWNLTFAGKADRLRQLFEEEPSLALTTAGDGATPFMWLPDDELTAVRIVELFLEHGANPGARDGGGREAAALAERRGLLEAAALLRRAMSEESPATSST